MIMKRTIALCALLLALPIYAAEKAGPARTKEVERRGEQVMPFDQGKTMHYFSKTKNGGTQKVLVKNAADGKQIRAIQNHLMEIAKKFSKRDFSDPEKIHGKDMPGLAELKSAKPGTIKVVYTELMHGAQIAYTSKDENLVKAIHRWFDAQLGDHGSHAMPGSGPASASQPAPAAK